MGKRRKAIEWNPGDPITEEADRARREFSPDIREDEREYYEDRLWVIRIGMGHVFCEEDLHFQARNEVLSKRDRDYQQRLGAKKVIEAQQERTTRHAQMMREVRAESVALQQEENRELAQQAIEWAKEQFPTAAADNSIDFLKTKAAEHLDITKRTLNNWLKK